MPSRAVYLGFRVDGGRYSHVLGMDVYPANPIDLGSNGVADVVAAATMALADFFVKFVFPREKNNNLLS